MSGSLALTRIASSLLITSPSTLMLSSFARCTSRDWSIRSRRRFCSLAAVCVRTWSGVQFWHSSWTSEVRLCGACSKSSRVMTSLFTRATISSTITDFVCAVRVPEARNMGTISHLFWFIGDIVLAGFQSPTRQHQRYGDRAQNPHPLDLSLSLRFQGKQHVSDTFGDPAAPLDAHPERAARVQTHPLPFGPDELDEFLWGQLRLRMKFDRHFVGSPLNRRNKNSFGQPLQQCVVQQISHGRGRGPKAVGEFAIH